MSSETAPSRFTYVAMALATVVALAILGRLAWALMGPAPPREVEFIGTSDDYPSCFGPFAWDGTVARGTCELGSRTPALVEFDPETARATVLHQWSVKNGITPMLQIYRPCEDGELFVVGSHVTTMVRRRGDTWSSHTAEIPSFWVHGAECSEQGVDLFAGELGAYVIYRFTDGTEQRLQVIPRHEVAGKILGAWVEGGAWHVVAHADDAILSGPFGSQLQPTGATSSAFSLCLTGPPGGWLGSSPPGCGSDPDLTFTDGAFRVTPAARGFEAPVVDVGPGHGYGVSLRGEGGDWLFRGRGALDFDLRRRGQYFEALRGSDAPVTVVLAPFLGFETKLRVTPLADERVAVWGNLGNSVMLLGPDLRRLDAPGAWHRVLHPLRGVYSNTGSGERKQFHIAIVGSLLWLMVLASYRRRRQQDVRYRRAAVLAFVVLGVCASGFFKVASWI